MTARSRKWPDGVIAVTLQPGHGAFYEQIAADIRAQISSGVLKPGEKLLSTAQLRARYGVSASVIQWAMVILKAEGLVVGQPGKGVYVSNPLP